MLLVLIVLVLLVTIVSGFNSNSNIRINNNKISSIRLNALSSDVIQKLDDILDKYSRLNNVVSDDSDKEKSQIQPIAEKYSAYKDVTKLMTRLKRMIKTEASETRKAKQLKNFIALLSGKQEIEEILKEKLGLPYNKVPSQVPELEAYMKAEAEIAALENKLKNVEFNVPQGYISTREERFGPN